MKMPEFFKKISILVMFVMCFHLGTAQQIHFLSDHFRGGATGGGYNPGNFDFTGNIDLNIPLGSTIRKAYFFASATKQVNVTNFPEPRTIIINGQPVYVSMDDALSNIYTNEAYGSPEPTYEMRTIIKDITHLTLSDNITILPPNQIFPPYYWEYYVLVLYENSLLPSSSIDVYVNTLNADSLMNYTLNPGMVIDNGYSVGFALNASHFCDTVQDGSNCFVNGNAIGLIGGDDFNTPSLGSCTGTTGGFFYESNSLFGLGDDTADEFFSGSDALANIQSYISNNQEVSISFEYDANFRPKSNNINQLFLTYTTSCDTFSVSTPSDTAVCLGSTLQLNASTSNPTAVYEWLPATGLSCANCPNPIFTADSSMFYTVRIWNNDSCSVVRPLKINVRPRPSFGDIEMMPSECGASSASATLFALPNNSSVQSWSEVGGNTQSSNVFQNLSAGNQTFYFTDTNGCQSADTTIFISEINTTDASFSANPSSGVAPLEVVFTNTSSNATNFEWFVDGNLGGNIANLPTWEFENSGYYEITLVAWQFDPSCADTFALTIMVYDSLIVQVPNVFTPNGDGINDFFAITSSLPVDVELVILNRWGVEVYKYSGSLQVGLNALWSGASVTDGTYFYTMKISKNEDTPFVKELENPMEKKGFVEVRR